MRGGARSNDVASAVCRIVALKADMCDERPPNHRCSSATGTVASCNPQNEEALYQHSAKTRHIYVCRYGSVHVCGSETQCTLWKDERNQTCPVSGAQFGGPATSSYDAGDSRTWYAAVDAPQGPAAVAVVAVAKPRFGIRHRVIGDEELRARAGAMITLLLYSNRRMTCNAAAVRQRQEHAASAMQTYRAGRAAIGQLPYAMDLYAINAHFTTKPLPYVMYEFSAELHAYYVSICCQLWHTALRYYVPAHMKRYDPVDGVTEVPPRIDFEDLCLGVLYAMRTGRVVGGVCLLPRDEFVLLNFPLICDFPTFGINKNQVTSGETILAATYENALAALVDPRELAVDVSKFTATSSEKLFMPTSRKKRT